MFDLQIIVFVILFLLCMFAIYLSIRTHRLGRFLNRLNYIVLRENLKQLLNNEKINIDYQKVIDNLLPSFVEMAIWRCFTPFKKFIEGTVLEELMIKYEDKNANL